MFFCSLLSPWSLVPYGLSFRKNMQLHIFSGVWHDLFKHEPFLIFVRMYAIYGHTDKENQKTRLTSYNDCIIGLTTLWKSIIHQYTSMSPFMWGSTWQSGCWIQLGWQILWWEAVESEDLRNNMEAAWTNLKSREKHRQKLVFPLKLIKTFLALKFLLFFSWMSKRISILCTGFRYLIEQIY